MAATCGQLFVDDVLTAVNGVEVSTDQAAKQLILESVGDVVFSVIRPELEKGGDGGSSWMAEYVVEVDAEDAQLLNVTLPTGGTEPEYGLVLETSPSGPKARSVVSSE